MKIPKIPGDQRLLGLLVVIGELAKERMRKEPVKRVTRGSRIGHLVR